MLDQNPNWRHARYSLDADYTEVEAAPLLAALIEKHNGFFWCEPYCFIIEGKPGARYIKRFPDWRRKLRIDMKKIIHKKPEKKFKQLETFFDR